LSGLAVWRRRLGGENSPGWDRLRLARPKMRTRKAAAKRHAMRRSIDINFPKNGINPRR
jgi:hypothetical protein